MLYERNCSTKGPAQNLQWLLLWFLQQNKLIFSVITITLGYDLKLSWKYCIYYHPLFMKIFLSYQTYAHLVQKFYSLSHQSLNFITLSSIYFCIILIFLRGCGAFHSYTVHLIVCLSKTDCPIYQEENHLPIYRCLRNVAETIPWLSKFI